MARELSPREKRYKVERDIREACRVSPWFFTQHFVKTTDPQDPNASVRTFPDYDFLRWLFDHFAAKDEKGMPRYPIIAIPKSRQMLVSWACVAYVCEFNDNKHCFLQSQKEKKAWELLERADKILRMQPPYVNPCLYETSRDTIKFSNGSKLEAVPQGPDQLAQYSPSVVVFDEAALQELARDAYKVIIPCLRNGGQLIAPSTPRGTNFFFDLCNRIPAAKVLRVHYSMHPEFCRQAWELGGSKMNADGTAFLDWERWKREMKKKWGYDEQTWLREMEINFEVEMGTPVFTPPFSKETHVCRVAPNPAWDIHVGWDYGFIHPAVVWFQQNPVSGQQVVLAEYMADNMKLPAFVREVKRRQEQMCPWGRFLHYCDPAGDSEKDEGPKSIDVLREMGIYPSFKKSRITEGMKLIQRNLEIRSDGLPGMVLDPSCEGLIRAFEGGVVFDTEQPAFDEKSDEKIRIKWGVHKHRLDALRYAMIHVYRLGAVERREARGPAWAHGPKWALQGLKREMAPA
jgi:hypothetical protein